MGDLRTLRGHRDDIQGLRAVAVLLVALSHAGVGFLAGGYVGVDVFFVLSGFLITGVLLGGAAKGRSALIDFYGRRAKRILPAATLTLVVTDLVANRLLNFVRVKELMQASISAAFFTANIHFARLGTDYFAQAQPPSPVQHFWSLAVEEQFYLVWPAVALIVAGMTIGVHRRSGPSGPMRGRLSALVRGRVRIMPARDPAGISPKALHVLLTVIAVVAIGSLAWSIRDTTTHPAPAYFSTLTRAWELALGAGLAVIAPRLVASSTTIPAIAGWVGAGAIATAAVLFSSSTPFPGYAALLPTVGAALVIGAGLAQARARWSVGRVLSVSPMRYVGDRSYTFYLWHWPALTIPALYVGHQLAVGVNLLILLGAFLVSIVTYKFFEHPIRRMTWSPSNTLALWPVSIVTASLVAGFILISTEQTATRLAVAALRPEAALGDAPRQAVENAKAAESARQAVAATAAGLALPAVKAAAEAAEKGAHVPSGLSPSPGALVGDHYTFPEGCAPAEGQTTSKICRLGDPSGATSIVLFGDSHAQMWMPALLGAAPRARWVVLPVVHSACTPASWTSALGSEECHAWYKWAVQSVTKLHPDVMLMTGAYSGDGSAGRTAALDAFSALSANMRRAAKHVVIITDPPGEGRNPVDCLLAENSTLGACSSTETSTQSATNTELTSLARTAGADVIDSTGWFCFEGRCPSVIGHTIAYSDGGHVSKTYSLELAQPFAAAVHRATKGSLGA